MTPAPRRYDSGHRRDQAARTRQQIAAAARAAFVRHGWAATTIDTVAAEAGVSPATVYSVFRSKRGLAAAVAESVNFEAGLDDLIEQLSSTKATPEQDLGVMVAYDCRLYRTSADLLRLLRSAEGQLPELEEVYAQGRAQADQTRHDRFSQWPSGTLRPGVSLNEAVDIYASTCHFDSYRLLLEERGWTPERVEEWWKRSLTLLLLTEPAGGR